MRAHVTIVETGREGQVIYTEGFRHVSGYWEFGGGDVVAIVGMGSVEDWRAHHPWALERRAQILRFVADEVLRQRAPRCVASIDEASGDIRLHTSSPASAASAPAGGAPAVGPDAAPVGDASAAASSAHRGPPAAVQGTVRRRWRRWSDIAVAAVLLLAAVLWAIDRWWVIDPGKGTPLGETLRTETHLATLIQTLQAHRPSLHRDHAKDRYRLGVFLVPLDGSAPRLVPLVEDLRGGGANLARVIGSDGRTMWIDANALHGVNLRTGAPIGVAAVRQANPGLPSALLDDSRGMDIVEGRLRLMARDRSVAYAIDPESLKARAVTPVPVNRPLRAPAPARFLAAGLVVSANQWLGLHSPAEREGAFRAGRWVRPVESAEEARQTRRLVRGQLDASVSALGGANAGRRIVSMQPLTSTDYLDAAFLRRDEKAEPIRLKDPDGALMLHTSAPGRQGTLVVSRVNLDGTVSWSRDTALDRFTLRQILPGEEATAFVGTRVPVPDTVSEPLLVIVTHATGQVVTHSLWR